MEDELTPEDVERELKGSEPELFRYVQLLPRELWSRHFEKLELISKDHAHEGPEAISELRINYILGILEAREKAIVEYEINEPELKKALSGPEDINSFGETLRKLLITRGNLLGFGQTARVKRLDHENVGRPIAVKYLLTPTGKTLSAHGEYDMSREVQTMIDIEHAEERAAVRNIHIPHPFFFYKRSKFQCYGMSEVDGVTIEELMKEPAKRTPKAEEVIDAVKLRFRSGSERNELVKEADMFMRAVHEVCLHGDIKARNVMVSRDGHLFLIDFGQSVPVGAMTDKTREQFENIMDLERAQLGDCIRQIWKTLENKQKAEIT